MTKISDKSADNQSEARISLAYNKSFVTDDKFCEIGPMSCDCIVKETMWKRFEKVDHEEAHKY